MTTTPALPRGLLILLGLASVTVAVAGLRSVADLVAPAFLALVLTLTMHPVRGALRARGVPGWLGTLAATLAVYVVLVGISLSLVLAAARFATLLPDYQEDFASLVDGLRSFLGGLGVGDGQVQALVSGLDLGRLSGVVTSLLTGVLSTASGLVFVVTLVLFMTMDGTWFPDRLDDAHTQRPQVVTALRSFAGGTRTYFVVSTVFGLVVAVIDTGLLWALGIPVPLLWGLLAFITNYIPNIGFVIGLVPPAVLGLLEGGPGLMLAVVVSYSVVNLIIQSVIQPKFVGDAVGLSTSITFLSLVFWSFVLGPLGALLAIPLTLLVRALLVDVDPGALWVRPLIAGRPNEVDEIARDG